MNCRNSFAAAFAIVVLSLAHALIAQENCKDNDYNCLIASQTRKIEADAQNPVLYHDRAVYRRWKKDCMGAVDDFTIALILKPEYTFALEGRAWAYLDCKNSYGAIRDFEKLVKLEETVRPEFRLGYDLGFAKAY